MKYILIAYMTFASSGGPFTAEFDDMSSCKAVAAEWLKDAKFMPSRTPGVMMNVSPKIEYAICVPKWTR